MCGCENHWDALAPCTCSCPGHGKNPAKRPPQSEAVATRAESYPAGGLTHAEREALWYAWHDGTCPEGAECRSRFVHTRAVSAWNVAEASVVAAVGRILADRLAMDTATPEGEECSLIASLRARLDKVVGLADEWDDDRAGELRGALNGYTPIDAEDEPKCEGLTPFRCGNPYCPAHPPTAPDAEECAGCARGLCDGSRHRTPTPAAPVAVEGVETIEWGVRRSDGSVATGRDGWHGRGAVNCASAVSKENPGSVPVCRTRRSYPDRVSEWSPVETETSEPEGGGRDA